GEDRRGGEAEREAEEHHRGAGAGRESGVEHEQDGRECREEADGVLAAPVVGQVAAGEVAQKCPGDKEVEVAADAGDRQAAGLEASNSVNTRVYMSAAASQPTAQELWITATARPRCLAEAYSATRIAPVAHSPPKPTPCNTRKISRVG